MAYDEIRADEQLLNGSITPLLINRDPSYDGVDSDHFKFNYVTIADTGSYYVGETLSARVQISLYSDNIMHISNGDVRIFDNGTGGNFAVDGITTVTGGLADAYVITAIPFGEAGETALDGTFTAVSVVGALNELKGEIVSENIWDRTLTTITPHNAGDDLNMGTGNLFVDAISDVSGNLSLSALSGNISFQDQYLTSSIPISELGVTGLDARFTAISIVGALNEALDIASKKKTGVKTIGSGADEIPIVFLTEGYSDYSDTTYTVTYIIENTADPDPGLLVGGVTSKATTGFTISLSANTDTGNYILNWETLE